MKSAKLTPNGAGSLIMTVPHELWRKAGIDHDDPRSVKIEYEDGIMTIDMRKNGGNGLTLD